MARESPAMPPPQMAMVKGLGGGGAVMVGDVGVRVRGQGTTSAIETTRESLLSCWNEYLVYVF